MFPTPLRHLIPIAVACALVGCGGRHYTTPQSRCTPTDTAMQCQLPPAPKGAVRPTGTIVARGIDFAWGGPSARFMQSNGFSFGASYLSNDPSKNWTIRLANSYQGANIARVFVWETSAGRALAGCGAGAEDARRAYQQGRPFEARVVYFAVDFEEQPQQAGTVASYFRCAGNIIGLDHMGAYGGYFTIFRLFNAGLIRYGWQTYAWSGGRWDPRAQLQQYLNGSSFDYDHAVAADYGQTPAPTPLPAPPTHAELRAKLRYHVTRRVIYHGLLEKHGCRKHRRVEPCREWFIDGNEQIGAIRYYERRLGR